MSDEQGAVTGPRSPRCDHICLREADHEGTQHFHGFENPSPRRPLADDPAAVERAAYAWLASEGLHRESEFVDDDDWETFLNDVRAVLRAAGAGEQ